MRHIDYDIKHILLLSLIVFFGLQSCVDDRLYIDMDDPVEEGMCRINANLEFKRFTPSNLGTRTAGDVYDGIRNLRVFIFNEDGTELIKNSPISVPSVKVEDNDNFDYSGEYLTRMKFNMTVPLGKYQLYAVANMPDGWTGAGISTVQALKSVSLTWKETGSAGTTYGQNDEMFGTFHLNPDASTQADNETNPDVLDIDKSTVNLSARLVRAASKVTVAYDGSGLKDGVKIYIKSLKLKNIAKSCHLAKENTVASDEDIITDGEGVVYSNSTVFDENFPGLIYNGNPYFPRKTVMEEGSEPTWDTAAGPHSHTNVQSLFFYENLQGTGPDKSKMKDDDKDGLLDEFYDYSQKPYGTYIEVDAYYESVNPERPGISNITYRFMLGQNITTDYNAKRNCHYKLTLKFNGFANEPDWRIDYVNYFGVTQPNAVDYQGRFFVPINQDNRGNTFSSDNIVTITSYEFESDSWANRYPLNYDIEYLDAEGKPLSSRPDWLDDFEYVSKADEKSKGITKLKIKYKNPYTEVDLSKAFKENKTGTYDLATKGGTTSLNTANSYIIDAGGTYSLPLVYGNAVQNGVEVSSTYTGFGDGGFVLNTLRNFQNKDISSAYILDDLAKYQTVDKSKITASLVWQDAEGLINQNVQFNSSAYDNKGGLTFSTGTLAEGNAVIAVKYDGVIMWSWHIWVTPLDLDRTLNLKLYADNDDDVPNDSVTIMPVNLGWCSDGNPVRYYDRHVCKVKFTQKLKNSQNAGSQTITIVQEPHTALPPGNNTFFQWGRKDPMMGSNASWTTKKWWLNENGSMTETTQNNPFLNELSFTYMTVKNEQTGAEIYVPIDNNDSGATNPNNRATTRNCLHEMIRNPQKLHNARFEGFTAGQLKLDKDGNPEKDPETGKYILAVGNDPTGNPYPVPNAGKINDESYSNLWMENQKTVYDPCPVGFKVSPVKAFTGFTTYGGGTEGIDKYGYNVIESNMLSDEKGDYKTGNMMFYTDKNTKLIATTFPLIGYRDYDSGEVYYHYNSGEGHTYVWEAKMMDIWADWYKNNYATFLKAYMKEPAYIGVGTGETFYATDACSVRPTKE